MVGILGAGALAVFLTFAAKILSFGRDVVMSAAFGANMATDAFFIANTIPGVVWAVVLVTINAVFLPLYMRLRVAAPAEAAAFLRHAVQIYLALALLIALACALAAGPIVHMTSPGAPPATLALAKTLTVIMSVGFAFSGYVAVQNAVQQAHGRFQAPLLVPVVNNLLAIAGVLVAWRMNDIRIAVVFAVGAWLVQAPLARWQTRDLNPRVTFKLVDGATFRRLSLLSLPVMLGAFLDQLNIYVGIYLAGGLGVGAISHLNYASRLAVFLATTFSTLVSYFLFPRLAADAAVNDDARTRRSVSLGVLLVAATTAPLMIVSFVLRHDIVSLVYGRGALGPADVDETARAFAYYSIGIVFVGVREIFNRLFFSFQKMNTTLVIGIASTVGNILASAWLSRSMGPAGIALGASVGAGIYLVGQLVAVALWKPGLLGRDLPLGLAAIVAATAPAWIVTTWLMPRLADMAPLPRFVLVSGTFGVVFLVVAAPIILRGGFLRLAGPEPMVEPPEL